MKVFISWSGELSNKIAIILKDWIPNVIQTVEPYVSSEDIDKGSRWSADIAKELANSTFGILVVTKNNFKAPWLNFEAGALSKELDVSRVCPLLFDIKRSEIEGPLLQFQVTAYTKEDVFKLMNSINSSCMDLKLSEERLKKTFEKWWPSLEEDLKIDYEQNVQPENNILKNISNDAILEEILSLVQTQQKILRRPDELLPPDYLIETISKMPKGSFNNINTKTYNIPSYVIDELIVLFNDLSQKYYELHLQAFSDETNPELISHIKELRKAMDEMKEPIIFLNKLIS